MKAEEFIKEVMHRASLGSREAAQDAVRATLETLSEHLTPGEVGNVSSQLPQELAVYMQQPLLGGVAERFSLDDFIMRVAEREGVSISEAMTNAHVVASLLGEVLSMGQLEHMIAQLPTDIAQLFITQNVGDVE
ncbi:MAG TPA: DUF2267 domain-containing protein [Ktedonobacter sp.]|nr:DUF2267 domain-containing protein [Ktedonobacter sp.]